MHKRPSLQEAKTFLSQYSPETMQEYHEIKTEHGEFLAARFIVEIVDLHNHKHGIGVASG